MCCGQVSRPTSTPVKQSESTQQVAMRSPRQTDTGNPVVQVNQNSTNVARANEVNRNNYHSNHYGLGR